MEENNSELQSVVQSLDLINQNLEEKEAIFEYIKMQVAGMLDNQSDLLFSYLYRLDIDELLIKKVLNGETAEIAGGLAQLIIDRQLQRLRTRQEYKKNDSSGWAF